MLSFLNVGRLFKDIFLPTYCPVCGKSVEKSGICRECLRILDGARLACERHSFELDGYTVQCRSVFSYEYEQVKTAVLFMKENPDSSVYSFFAAYLAGAVRDLGYSGDAVITYVPRSDEGMRDNGFDQSLILAKAVSRLVPHTVCLRLLKRVGKSKAQKSLTGKEREENVKGKFRAVKTAASPKNIIITDDMFTTGSSVRECAAVLRKEYPEADIFCVTVAGNPESVKLV